MPRATVYGCPGCKTRVEIVGSPGSGPHSCITCRTPLIEAGPYGKPLPEIIGHRVMTCRCGGQRGSDRGPHKLPAAAGLHCFDCGKAITPAQAGTYH